MSSTAMWDIVVGSIALYALLVGLPSNIVSAVIFFQRKPRTPPIMAHAILAVLDAWICLNGYPFLITMVTGRSGSLFSGKLFYILWSLNWHLCINITVILVLFISVMRVIKLSRFSAIVTMRGLCYSLSVAIAVVVTRAVAQVVYVKTYILPHLLNNTTLSGNIAKHLPHRWDLSLTAYF
eukprot:sb/3471720/